MAPVAGTLQEIQRGPKRKIEALIFNAQGDKTVQHKTTHWDKLNREEAIDLLLNSETGLLLGSDPMGL